MMSDTITEDLSTLLKNYNQLENKDERIQFIAALRSLEDEQITAVFKTQTNNDLLRFKESLKHFEIDENYPRLDMALSTELQMRRVITSRKLNSKDISTNAQMNLSEPENAYVLEQLYKRAAHKNGITNHFDSKNFNQDLVFKFDNRTKRLALLWPDPRDSNSKIISLNLSSNETIDFAGQATHNANLSTAKIKLLGILNLSPKRTPSRNKISDPAEVTKASLAFVSNIGVALTCPITKKTFEHPALLIKENDAGRGFVYEQAELQKLGYSSPADYTLDRIMAEILAKTKEENIDNAKEEVGELLKEMIELEFPQEVLMLPNGYHFLSQASVDKLETADNKIVNPQTREKVAISKLTHNYNLEKIVQELKGGLTAEFKPAMPSKGIPSLLTKLKNKFFSKEKDNSNNTNQPPKLKF